MIFLDWLLRFHPIIIILLQGPATWTPEVWLRRKLWLCLSGSLLAPAPMVTWSHATGSLLFVGHSNVSCAPDSGPGGKMPWYSGTWDNIVSDITNFTLIRTQTTDWELNRAQITFRECWMFDVWWRKAGVCRYLSTVNLAVSHQLPSLQSICLLPDCEPTDNTHYNSWITLTVICWAQ